MKPPAYVTAVLLFVAMVVMPCTCWSGGSKTPFRLKIKEQGPFRLRADRFILHKEEHILEAIGHVMLRSKSYRIEADYARYNQQAHLIYLRGHVKALWGGDTIRAEEVEVNVSSSLGWIRNGEIFYAAPHLYFKGKFIEKTGENTYRFTGLTITGCDNSPPSWSLYVKRGEMERDGDARLYHILFNVKDHPLLYFPYLQLPVLRRRKSGILIPEFVSSSRDGMGGIVPYYLVLSKEDDITFYPGYYSKRGPIFGIEYRATPNVESKLFLMASWLHDKIYSLTDSEDLPQFQGDGLIRPNKNRYWIRGKVNTYLVEPWWSLKMDVDYASDQNLLREFDSGYLGFKRSRDTFLSEFGRNINNKDSLIRTNTLLVSRNFSSWEGYVKVVYNEDLAYMNGNNDPSQNPTVQTLPELGINLSRTPLPWGDINIEAQTTADYFWRRYGDTGARVDIYPTFTRTFNSNYATIIPRLSFRETLYMLDHRQSSSLDRFENRNIWETGVNISTELFRIYHPLRGMALRHRVIPEVDYLYRPSPSTTNVPQFDSVDSISRANRVTYSLSNIFTLKRGTLNPTYIDILTLKLEQSYDLEEAGREKDLDKYPRRPFTDIRMDWKINYPPPLSVGGTLWFSPYIRSLVESETSARLNPVEGLSLFGGYDYQRKLTNDIHRIGQERLSVVRYGTILTPSPQWKLSFEEQRDLVEGETIKREIDMRYNHQCWSLDVLYTHTEDEDRVEFSIVLGTLGEINQGLSLKR